MAKDIIKDINKLARTQGAFFNLLTVFLFAIVLGIGISTGNWIFDLVDRHLNISKRADLPDPKEKAGGQVRLSNKF